MTDERQSGLPFESWLKGTDPTPPDASRSVAQVMDRVPKVRQRGRWWPLPVFDRKPKSPTATATDTTDYRPRPIPAANGHAPTVIGRTQTMFSPVKTITAGALVFALGGVLLISQPFGQQNAAVPGAQAPEPTGVTVTVTQQCNDVGHSGCDWTASDPRLTGRIAVDWGGIEGVRVAGAEQTDAGLMWMDVTFTEPEGGWTGRAYTLWGEPTQRFLVLSGTRANEGWQYVASGIDPERDNDFEWTGTLYEGELPPFPEPPAE